MTDIGSGNYMGDGQILAWLEQKSDGQYANLSDMMNVSDSRSQLMNELTQVRANFDGNHHPADLYQQMEKVRAEYKDTPYEAEVNSLLLPLEAKVLPAIPGTAEQYSDLKQAITASNMSSNDKDTTNTWLDAAQVTAADDPDGAAKAAQDALNSANKEISGKLQGEIEDLGKIDQLDLIKIQELSSDARQTAQLASNLIAARDQTSNAIVGNIRG